MTTKPEDFSGYTQPVIPGDPFGAVKQPVRNISPDPKTVNDFHARADTDSGQIASHHTLGTKHDQASAGDHNHDGSNSVRLLEGVTLSGSTGGNAALQNLIAMLSDALGFTDSTT